VDMPITAHVPQHKEVETQEKVHPKIAEEALEVNGTTQNLEGLAQPAESQMTISGQPTEEIISNTSAWT
jgi:hypothetical protein